MKSSDEKAVNNPFTLRLSAEDRERFTAAAKEDGYDELAPWFRWLARVRAKKVLGGKNNE